MKKEKEAKEVKKRKEAKEVSGESCVYRTGQHATQPARKVGPFVPLQERWGGGGGRGELSETKGRR